MPSIANTLYIYRRRYFIYYYAIFNDKFPVNKTYYITRIKVNFTLYTSNS